MRLFRHIHVPVVEKEAGVLLVNPGSLAYPRQRGRRPSYAVMETDGKDEMHVRSVTSDPDIKTYKTVIIDKNLCQYSAYISQKRL